MMSKNFIIIVFAFISCFTCTGQKVSEIRVAASNHQVSLPFKTFSPIQSGGELGVVFMERNSQRIKHAVLIETGYFSITGIQNHAFLRAKYALKYNVSSFLSPEVSFGGGYNYSIFKSPVYKLNSDTGEFERSKRSGKGGFISNLGIGLNFKVNDHLVPFICYDLGLTTSAGLLFHSFYKLGIGVRI